MQSIRMRSVGPTLSGLLVVPALPFIFDDPVEQGVGLLFRRIEAAAQRIRGSDASSSACDRYNHMSSISDGYQKRDIDKIKAGPCGSTASETDTPNLSRAAILGVGVDLVFMPRIGQLIARHARRAAKAAITPMIAVAPHYARTNASTEFPNQLQLQSLEMQGARRLAKRILSPSEEARFAALPQNCLNEQHVRYLASR